jgi:hypothetical protein
MAWPEGGIADQVFNRANDGLKLDWVGDAYGLVTKIQVSFLTKAIDWMEVRWEDKANCGGELVGGGVMRHTFWNFVDKPVEVISTDDSSVD